jgi:hypothetical protein
MHRLFGLGPAHQRRDKPVAETAAMMRRRDEQVGQVRFTGCARHQAKVLRS